MTKTSEHAHLSEAGDPSAAFPSVAFLFNAQAHQIMHGITTAEALAKEWRVQVDIVSPSLRHLDFARSLVLDKCQSSLQFRVIGSRLLNRLSAIRKSAVPPKLLTLFFARRQLNGYSAIALPERTSTIIRKLGVKHPKLIHIDHGAGDRAVGYDPRIALFDFALVAGPKQERRMLEERLIRPGAYKIVGYPKFDAIDRVRDAKWNPFENSRSIILYNPHFSQDLGSWNKHGIAIIRNIIADGNFNLIVAPHIRMCDNAKIRAQVEEQLAEFAGYPNVHIDLGSERSVDMTYTTLADIYLGDVSSQIYEFLRRPKPAIFMNSHNVDWDGSPDYAHWQFGPVVQTIEELMTHLHSVSKDHLRFEEAQKHAFSDTFDMREGVTSSKRAAAAIADFLQLRRR